MTVHNHGTEEGKGLACRESVVNGELKGECMTDDLRTHRNVNAAPVPDCHCQHCDRKRIKRSTFDLLGDGTVLLYGDKIKLWNIHPAEACAGRPCVIHNPTDHHMRSWRLHWRNDRKIFERLCPLHGTGHPDPDQFNYWDSTGQEWQSVHGCCGCCRG